MEMPPVQLDNVVHLEDQIAEYHNGNLESFDGLTPLDSGWNRRVYRISSDTYGTDVQGMVLKIQDPGSHENREEVSAWRHYQTTQYKKYLVPIVDYASTYEWLVMPYGESVPENLVDTELYDIMYDNLAGTDISKDDFVYMDGNYANQRCCDYASIDKY